jgi:hypothetical protein
MGIGKALLCRMLSMMFSSCEYLGFCKWYDLSQLYTNLMDAYLCWAGWLVVYGMMECVKVGFLYMPTVMLIVVLCRDICS